MRTRAICIFLLLALCAGGISYWKARQTRAASAAGSAAYFQRWNPTAAATYLDARETWWQSWPPAQKGHGTICISCHTVVPYALARPELQQELGRKGRTAEENIMLASIEKRVNRWTEMAPFYTDADDGPGKTAQSRATEAVLNAVILASYDTQQGHLRQVTRDAFDEAWALQETTGVHAGGWKWQNFHLAPWESANSGYQGAALLAVALGNAPDGYAGEPGISIHLQRLREYLRSQYAAQPVMNKLYVLWASAHMSGLLDPAQRTRLLTEIGTLQQSDGGWTLPSLDNRTDWKQWLYSPPSDGCATGLVVLAIEESGVDGQEKMLNRGRQWLEHHQTKDGSWRASSLNARRDPNTDIGRFMSDAATGYAVLALEAVRKQSNRGGTL